jgi:hypothetical protein
VRAFLASDLHVDAPGNAEFVRRLAVLARDDRPDVVIIAGDVCNGVRDLAATLRLFAPAAPARIYVPGNHELWATRDGDAGARERYYRELPAIARAEGFHPLVTESVILGDVGFAGTMGWYDYSFAGPIPEFPESELATKRRDGLEWLDRRFVRWTDAEGAPLTDAEVADLMIADLRAQLESLAGTALRSVVLVTHHLAFTGVIPPIFVDGRLRFFRAFLGSTRLGDAAASDPRITLALAGHVHSVRSARHGRIEARTCPVGYPRERRADEPVEARRLLIDV